MSPVTRPTQHTKALLGDLGSPWVALEPCVLASWSLHGHSGVGMPPSIPLRARLRFLTCGNRLCLQAQAAKPGQGSKCCFCDFHFHFPAP